MCHHVAVQFRGVGAGGGMGQALLMERAKPKRSSLVLMRRVAGIFRPYQLSVAALIATVTTAAIVGLGPPVLFASIIDNVSKTKDATRVNIDAFLILLAVLAGAMLTVVQSYLNNRIEQGVMYEMRNRLYAHLQTMSLRFFTSTRSGEILSRLNNDVSGVQDAVTNSFTAVFSNLVLVISTVVLMAYFDWRLTVFSL